MEPPAQLSLQGQSDLIDRRPDLDTWARCTHFQSINVSNQKSLGGASHTKWQQIVRNNPQLHTLILNNIGLQWSLTENLSFHNLTHLDLSHNPLFDQGATAIAQTLRTNNKLLKLFLEKCQIAQGGGLALADAMKSNTTLQELSLRENHFGDTVTQAFRQGLDAHRLQKLKLEFTGCHPQDTAGIEAEIDRRRTPATPIHSESYADSVERTLGRFDFQQIEQTASGYLDRVTKIDPLNTSPAYQTRIQAQLILSVALIALGLINLAALKDLPAASLGGDLPYLIFNALALTTVFVAYDINRLTTKGYDYPLSTMLPDSFRTLFAYIQHSFNKQELVFPHQFAAQTATPNDVFYLKTLHELLKKR
ncbi:MAG: hypothetical protein KDK65_02675 [Chlamydiia bacterium]|nr:hypothetical protein [Chlamydiia bacterium]